MNSICNHSQPTYAVAKMIVETLTQRGETLSCAESCTGGLVAAAITDIPGSSNVFLGAAVAYDNLVKQKLLDVDEQTLRDEGAVSAPVASQMAEGVRRTLLTDWALSTTGIAGPGGGSDTKPTGLVFIALSGAGHQLVERHIFSGNRQAVREQTVLRALQLLCQTISV